MIKLLHESFKNLPTWLTSNLKKLDINKLNNKGIDLYNCTFEETNDLKIRDSRWTDPNLIPVFLLRDTYKNKEFDKLYIWGIVDPYINDGKDASEHTRQWLLKNSLYKGFINISTNKKINKDKYIDPRYANVTYSKHKKYAGQQKSAYSDNYVTFSNRDKSGYKIPNPVEKLSKLYDMHLDNYADVLDRYYNKLNILKKKIFNIDIKSDIDTRIYSRSLGSLSSTIQNYKNLVSDIDNIIKTHSDMSEEEFKKHIDWSGYREELNSDIVKLSNYLKELEG